MEVTKFTIVVLLSLHRRIIIIGLHYKCHNPGRDAMKGVNKGSKCNELNYMPLIMSSVKNIYHYSLILMFRIMFYYGYFV